MQPVHPPPVAAFRCQRCGAPLEATPESIVVVCPYCGFPNWTAQAYAHPIVMVEAERARGEEYFRRYLETDPDMRGIAGRVELRSLELIYVPFYYVDAEAQGSYYGSAVVTLTKVEVVHRGQRTETRVRTDRVRVTVSGSYRHQHLIDVVARRSVDSRIADVLSDHYLATRPPTRPVAEVDWGRVKGQVLAAELPAQDAASLARDEACDASRAMVEERMRDEAVSRALAMRPGWSVAGVSWLVKRIPCRARALSVSPITLLPYFEYRYAYRGATYTLALAGWDGGKLLAEEPIGAMERVASAAGAAAAAGLLGGGGLAYALAAGEPGLGLLALIIAGAANYLLARRAVAEVRVERGRGGGGGGVIQDILDRLQGM